MCSFICNLVQYSIFPGRYSIVLFRIIIHTSLKAKPHICTTLPPPCLRMYCTWQTHYHIPGFPPLLSHSLVFKEVRGQMHFLTTARPFFTDLGNPGLNGINCGSDDLANLPSLSGSLVISLFNCVL